MKLLDTTALIQYWGGVDAIGSYLEANEDHEFVTTTLNLMDLPSGESDRERSTPRNCSPRSTG